jgi:hypothetical protein
MTKIAPWTSVADFLFGTPLYEKVALSDKRTELRQLFVADVVRFDAHCPYCGQTSTFNRTDGQFYDSIVDDYIRKKKGGYRNVTVTCARRDDHWIHFWMLIDDEAIQKVGQFPSFADIANDESKRYRKFLSRDDGSEIHKAIGLAAHGVGIGAFVYLRRIFERLVNSRFVEFREVEGWKYDDFLGLRMDEKIDFLKGHLPPFMVRNSKLYSILSLGIHQLSEQECLAAFDFIKQSIFFILDEDIKKKEELAAKAALEKAIAKYTEPASNEGAAATGSAAREGEAREGEAREGEAREGEAEGS